jgi:hypothetical protein
VTSYAVPTERREARIPSAYAPRLVGAELLKLRKRRGLVVLTALLTVVVSVALYAVLAILHAVNPAHHAPAGGIANLGHGVAVLGSLGSIAAVIVGATAGTGDLGAGVFRELVVTGRSRRALYAVRIPGGLAFVLPFVVLAYGVVAVASVVFAQSLRTPATDLVVVSGLWTLAHVTFYFLLALGLGSLLGSRSTTVVALLAWMLAIAPILLSLNFLGASREALPNAAIRHFAPHRIARYVPHEGPSMSLAVAIVTLLVWVVVALALGGWHTQTRDA